MPLLGNVNVDDYIACVIRTKVQEIGGFEWVTMGIAGVEADFNQGALGDEAAGPTVDVGGVTYNTYLDPASGRYYCSAGLLQLNTCGGQGTGHDFATLLDARANLDVGQPFIARAIWNATVQGFQGQQFMREVCRQSGHPGLIPIDDPRLQIYVEWMVRLITGPNGQIVAWPPNNPALCSGAVPPPPPLGSWTEGPQPTNKDQAEAAMTRHFDRVDELFKAF